MSTMSSMLWALVFVSFACIVVMQYIYKRSGVVNESTGEVSMPWLHTVSKRVGITAVVVGVISLCLIAVDYINHYDYKPVADPVPVKVIQPKVDVVKPKPPAPKTIMVKSTTKLDFEVFKYCMDKATLKTGASPEQIQSCTEAAKIHVEYG